MAALSSLQVVPVWRDGLANHTVMYALRNISAGDTADLSGDFQVIKVAVVMGATANGGGLAAVSGTTVTMPGGLNADAAWMLARGAAA